jgi:hypothetical protein
MSKVLTGDEKFPIFEKNERPTFSRWLDGLFYFNGSRNFP